ncbi:MAG: hypothetical protein OES13_04220 [Acidimicrobiia bacterium]|nr:hypothetical protein [Acidimicrobiia bacterium]
MEEFSLDSIDPSQGPHAAAGLTDEEVEFLSGMLIWELGVRFSKDEYLELLERAGSARERLDEEIEFTRNEREQMRFEIEVLDDIESLPTIEHPTPPTGLYL